MERSIARYLFLCLICALSFSIIAPNSALADNIQKALNQPKVVTPPDMLDYGPVRAIRKPNLIELENGKIYKLANTRVPIYYQADAVEALEKLLVGKTVLVYHHMDPTAADNTGTTAFTSEAKADRYGIKPVQVIIEEDNTWVQDYLISNGLSWAFSAADSSSMMPILKKMEHLARQEARGFWAAKLYRIKNTEEVKEYLGSYQIVEGKVLDVTKKGYAAYINFGKDWRTDFTITLPREHWKTFEKSYFKFDPRHLEGVTLRVRGWVEDKNGPMILVDHVDQLDVFSKEPRWKRLDVK